MSRTAAEERLAGLRGRGRAELAPLWIEALPADEALGALAERQGALARLQEAHVYLDQARVDEAREKLEGVGDDLPAGVAAVREGLRGRLSPAPSGGRSAAPARTSGVASKTLARLYETQGDTGAAAEVYREVLTRDPTDREARRRLGELTGEEGGGAPSPLARWLDRVRRWRGVLRV